MIEIFLPSYIDSFKTLLENLQSFKSSYIANPDDERELQGVGPDLKKIEELYTTKAEGEDAKEQEKSN